MDGVVLLGNNKSPNLNREILVEPKKSFILNYLIMRHKWKKEISEICKENRFSNFAVIFTNFPLDRRHNSKINYGKIIGHRRINRIKEYFIVDYREKNVNKK